MNDKLYNAMAMTLDQFQHPSIHFGLMDPEILWNLASLPIPNLIVYKGKDIKEYNWSREDFIERPLDVYEPWNLECNLNKISNYISIIANKTDNLDQIEALLNNLEPYEVFHEQADNIYRWFFPTLRGIVLSIEEMIPSNPSNKDKSVIKTIRATTEKMSKYLDNSEDIIKSMFDVSFPCGFNTPLLAASPHRERFCVRLVSEPCTVGRNTA